MEPREIFTIIEPASPPLLELTALAAGLGRERYLDFQHPQEDQLLFSQRYPIFVVADGVTLEPHHAVNYPNPSGAGMVAQLFCEAVVREAERLYDTFGREALLAIFRKANAAVGAYNGAHGRTRETSNFWDVDLFAATGAFAVLRAGEVYWATICDSYVAHFGGEGQRRFISPGCWELMRKHLPPHWRELDPTERRTLTRKIYRNRLDDRGEPIGYGVITGEATAEKYLHYGSFPVAAGDLVTLFTDGFEEYMKLPEFLALFTSQTWPPQLEARVKQFTAEKSQADPPKFGHERSLLVVRL